MAGEEQRRAVASVAPTVTLLPAYVRSGPPCSPVSPSLAAFLLPAHDLHPDQDLLHPETLVCRYNILVAHNTLYRVGASGAPFSIRQGLRSCDGELAGTGWAGVHDPRCSQAAIVGRGCQLFPPCASVLPSLPDDYPERCSQYHRAGGWGQPGGMPQWAQISIPNRNVFLVNNLVVNPAGYTTAVGLQQPSPFLLGRDMCVWRCLHLLRPDALWHTLQ